MRSLESQLTPEQEIIIARAETRLSAGLTDVRLSLETGVEVENIIRLLKRSLVKEGWHGAAVKETAEAISAIAGYLDNEENTKQAQAGLASTSTLQESQSIFAHAHKYRKLVAITGNWGIGKSKAATNYVEAHPRGYNKPGALCVRFVSADKKPAAVYSKILGALRGNNSPAYRTGNYHDAIGAVLSPDDFMILDECNHINESLEVVRSIYDDFGVGIVMIGNPDFSRAVWGKGSRYAALASRADRFEFPTNTVADVEAWLAWRGIMAKVAPAERCKFIKEAVKIGTRPGHNGGLRALASAIDNYEQMQTSAPLDGALMVQLVLESKGVFE